MRTDDLATGAVVGVMTKASRGVFVVIVTHGLVLLRNIQTLVALGKLSPDLVSLNWFVHDPKTSATQVTVAVFGVTG